MPPMRQAQNSQKCPCIPACGIPSGPQSQGSWPVLNSACLSMRPGHKTSSNRCWPFASLQWLSPHWVLKLDLIVEAWIHRSCASATTKNTKTLQHITFTSTKGVEHKSKLLKTYFTQESKQSEDSGERLEYRNRLVLITPSRRYMKAICNNKHANTRRSAIP